MNNSIRGRGKSFQEAKDQVFKTHKNLFRILAEDEELLQTVQQILDWDRLVDEARD